LAAQRLAASEHFQRARVVKVHPSLNANALRELCYAAGKLVLVPPLPGSDFLYIQVDGNDVPAHQRAFASTKRGFKRFGRPILSLLDVPAVDLVVVASTAVCPANGARLGKGAGYGEVEWGILAALGRVSDHTTVATLVHDVQLVSESELPREAMAGHDLPVDLIATPQQLVYTGRAQIAWQKPEGIDWSLITAQMAVDIGALRQLRTLQNLPDLPMQPELQSSNALAYHERLLLACDGESKRGGRGHGQVTPREGRGGRQGRGARQGEFGRRDGRGGWSRGAGAAGREPGTGRESRCEGGEEKIESNQAAAAADSGEAVGGRGQQQRGKGRARGRGYGHRGRTQPQASSAVARVVGGSCADSSAAGPAK